MLRVELRLVSSGSRQDAVDDVQPLRRVGSLEHVDVCVDENLAECIEGDAPRRRLCLLCAACAATCAATVSTSFMKTSCMRTRRWPSRLAAAKRPADGVSRKLAQQAFSSSGSVRHMPSPLHFFDAPQ